MITYVSQAMYDKLVALGWDVRFYRVAPVVPREPPTIEHDPKEGKKS